jgi:class 3 adenylate cyclase/tetratricopeptide (TPR) repeat protein
VPATLTPYLPRFAIEWDLDAPSARWREFDATCCFVDISGFTALSERLARRGRIGAEELTDVLNHVFSRMLAVAYDHGGSLLKFGGDALLLAFTNGEHAVESTRAAVGMRAVLRESRSMRTSVGRLNLRMSVGVHSGLFDLFAVGDSHRELLIAGPAATVTANMEQTAEAGEIVVSPATAARLPGTAVGASKGDGFLLRWRAPANKGVGSISLREVPESVVEHGIPVALREHLRTRVDSEHRVASIAFVKFTGLDSFLLREGGDATGEALHEVVETVQRAAENEQVTFLASDIDANGGKIILATGVPVARYDDEGRILRAVRVISDADLPLSIQIGVNRGHVFAGEIGTEFRRTYTVMGDTVNLAARLMAAAPAGSVYATSGVLDLSGTLFAATALEPLRVKGKAEPVRAYEVGAAVGPREDDRATLPFVGREAELAALQAVARAATRHEARVALVEGNPGAGKTRLVSELVATATRVMQLRGESYATDIPYMAWRRPLCAMLGLERADRDKAASILRDTLNGIIPKAVPLAPLLAPLLDIDIDPTVQSIAIASEFRRERLGELVLQLLTSELGPDLVVIDDAQWLDDASASIAAHVTTSDEAGFLTVVARRPDGHGFRPHQPDVSIALDGIDDDAARHLVDVVTASTPLRPQEREQIVTRAAGNPLFLGELLRLARSGDLDALPDSLGAVATRELDDLGPEARRVVRHASVLGTRFDVGLLFELIGADVVEGALAREISACITVKETQAEFRTAVLQEAAYESLPFKTRTELHRRAGEAILRLPASDATTTNALLSLHFSRAQDRERTWEYARVAGRLAAAADAPDEAATHLERAVAAARHIDVSPEEHADVLVEFGDVLVTVGMYDRADDAYRRAATRVCEDLVGRARIAERRSQVQGEHQGRFLSAIRHARAGRRLLAESPTADPSVGESIRVRLLAREAEMRFRQGHLEAAASLCGDVIRDAEPLHEDLALANAMSVLDMCLYELGRPAETPHTTKALAFYERAGDNLGVAVALGNLGTMLFMDARWADAADYYVRAAQAATQAGDFAGAAVSYVNLGELRINQGRLAEAETALVPAWRTLQSNGYRIGIAPAAQQLGRARAFLGHYDEGLALLRDAIVMYDEIGALQGSVEARARIAEVSLPAGRIDAAADALREARALAAPLVGTPLHVLLDRIEATLGAVRNDALSHDWLDDAIALARQVGAQYDLLILLTLAASGRDTDETHRELAEIAAALEIVELPPLAGLANGSAKRSRRSHPTSP